MPGTPKKANIPKSTADAMVNSIALPALVKMIQDVDKDINKRIDEINSTFKTIDIRINSLRDKIIMLETKAVINNTNSNTQKSISSEESKRLAMDFINSMDDRYMVRNMMSDSTHVNDAMKWRRFKKFFDAEL